MDLIEQLGGYEKAKRELQLKEQNSVLQCCITVTAEMIRDALLEYRRQHNIYDVEDWVVHIFYKDSMLQRIKGVDGNYIYVLSHDESYQYKAYSPDFRHATDAEIKAGKRLEVK